MKQEYRKTKPPSIEENYDRPQKKRGGKKKPFRIVACGYVKLKTLQNNSILLGRYETRERAEQALKKLSHTWGKCVIEPDVS